MNKMLSRLDSIHEQYVNITFIPNLFPLLIKEILTKNTIGILNFVNPDEIELTTLIEWYKKNKQLNIKYHSVKSKFFCGLLCTDKLSNLTNNEIISIKEVFLKYNLNISKNLYLITIIKYKYKMKRLILKRQFF